MTYKKKGNVDLYYFRISYELNKYKEYSDSLSQDEIDKSNKFHFKKDRECFVVCRGALRRILSKYISLRPDDIIFNYNSFGKPYISRIQNGNNVEFNTSHSGDYCLIGVGRSVNIGVDIEKISRLDDYCSIARNYFSNSEYTSLENINDTEKLRCFYTIWTQKEALVKASGQGLHFGLDHWSTRHDTEEYILSIDSKKYYITSLNIDRNYQSALCVADEKLRCQSEQS